VPTHDVSRAWPRQPTPPTDRARTPVHRYDRRSLSPALTSAPSIPSPRAARPWAWQTDPHRPTNGIPAILRSRRPLATAHARRLAHAVSHTVNVSMTGPCANRPYLRAYKRSQSSTPRAIQPDTKLPPPCHWPSTPSSCALLFSQPSNHSGIFPGTQ
jgi:hypothetical protein